MANFNIDIQLPPIPEYNGVPTVYSYSLCTPSLQTVALKLENFINSYVGEPWDKLVITSINTNDDIIGLWYNSSQLELGNLPLEINCLGLLIDAEIPLLEYKFLPSEGVASETSHLFVYFHIVDSRGQIGPTKMMSIQITWIDCPIIEPTISNIVHGAVTSDNPFVDFNINGSPNTIYKYRIFNYNVVDPHYTGMLYDVDNDILQDPSICDGSSGAYSDGEITTEADGVLEMYWQIKVTKQYSDNTPYANVFIYLFTADGLSVNYNETVNLIATF